MPFYDQAMETAPRERLRTLQFQKLQKLLREISGRNRFYTKKWNDAGIVPGNIRLLSDLQKFPFTSKWELVRAQEEAPPEGFVPKEHVSVVRDLDSELNYRAIIEKTANTIFRISTERRH